MKFSFSLIVLLICLSANASGPPDHLHSASFKLSQINHEDISNQLTYLSIGQAQLPKLASQIKSWLAGFNQRNIGDHAKGRYVTAFTLYNDTQSKLWFIHPYGSIVEEIEIVIFSHDGPAQSVLLGQNHQNQQPLHYGSEIRLQPGEQKQVLMVFNSEYFFAPVKIALQPLNEAKRLFATENIVAFISLGICLALGLYNLFIFFVTRDSQYLFYALYSGFNTLTWLSIFAVFEYAQWSDLRMWLIPGFILASAFLACFQMAFLRSQLTAKLVLLYRGIIVSCLVSLPLAFYNLTSAVVLASLLNSTVIITGLYGGVKAWYLGYKPAGYFVLALLCVLLPNILSNLLSFGLLAGVNVNVYIYGLVGMALNTFLLAFALAVKVRLVNSRTHHLNNQLQQTVTRGTLALKKTNEQLALHKHDLAQANASKGRFLANMSHEILTPLTSIVGYAEAILLGDIDKAEQERVTKIIHENGQHLLKVINDILDISKTDGDNLHCESIPTNLFALLADVESQVSMRATDKGLAFHLRYIYPLPVNIYTDAARLKQILFNLTDNALKFTQRGHIGLEVSIQDTKLLCKVNDSGEGISTTQLANLFTPFTQADSSVNRRLGGMGLGLSISKRLAQGLDGQLSAQSQLRKGSTFTLEINLKVVQGSTWVDSVSQVNQAINIASKSIESLPRFAHSRVLLVDDHPHNRELITVLLKRMEIEVISVANGNQALELIFIQQFDLILLDIHMPLISGVDTLKQIRQMGNQTPVIALTANNMQHEIDYYIRAGFNNYLPKPIDRDEFIAKIAYYLSPATLDPFPSDSKKMQELIAQYCLDLDLELDTIQQAWIGKKLTVVADIAHKINGSAASYGLSIIGSLFAEIERLALHDDEIGLSVLLPKTLRFSHMCISLPGVDIATAIVNYNNKCELFLSKLPNMIEQVEKAMDEARLALSDGDLTKVVNALQPLEPLFSHNGFKAASVQLAGLHQLSQSDDLQYSAYLVFIDTIRKNLRSINIALEQSQGIEYGVKA